MTTALENPLRSDPSTVVDLVIRLEQDDHPLPECHSLPIMEYGPESFYHAPEDPLSIARLPDTGEEYEYGCSIAVRQNARFASRRGYRYERIDRGEWIDDLFELRSSTDFRQGRPMHPAYMQREEYGSDIPPIPQCPRHTYTVHGVIDSTRHLRAYAQVAQCGEVVRLNTILGHWEHLRARVMWLLVLELVKWHIDERGARFAIYYTHDSGHGDGLRYFKERLGFRPSRVEWDFS